MLSRTEYCFLGLLVIFLLFTAVSMLQMWLGFVFAVVLIGVTYPIGIKMGLSKKEAGWLWVIILLHIVCAIICVTHLNIVRAFGPDAIGFMHAAQAGPHPWGAGVGAYVTFIRLFYVPSPSFFSVFMTSVVGLLLFCMLLLAVAKAFQIRQYFLPILIIATCVPTDIISTSIALREVWEVSSIVLTVLCLMCLLNRIEGKFLHILGLLVGLCIMASLHKGLFYAAFLFVPVFYAGYQFMKISDRVDFLIRLGIILLVLFFCGLVLSILAGRFNQFVVAALSFSGRIPDGGSTYTIFFKAGDGFVSNLLRLPLALLYYWFYPFPWDIHRVKDIYGCLVGLMRLFFILYSFYFVLTSSEPRQRHLGGALLVILLMISMIFAIGTSNYGTSLRHNILTFWGFVTLGVPGFYLHCYRKRCRRLGIAP